MSNTISKTATTFGRFVRVISVLLLASAAFAQGGQSITVNCDNGDSLNGKLAKLNKQAPHTVIVQGTCTEFVSVNGFEGLTLRGQAGATIQQPATNPQNNSYVLSITGSRGINVFGLSVSSLPSIFSGIGIGKGSSQVQLQNVSVTGSWGIVVYEESQVWLVQVNVTINSGYAAVSAFDKSDVHIAGGLLQRPADGNFYAGLVDTTQPVDVMIDNPSGTNTNGAIVTDGSSLNLGSARLRIRNAGQSWGGTSGAVFVTNNSTLNAGASLIITNSQGQGVIVTNNSHATFGGSSITGGQHGGLVAANLSTIDIQQGSALTLVGGNRPDLFCDASSYVTGTANLSGVPTSGCANQLLSNYSSLP